MDSSRGALGGRAAPVGDAGACRRSSRCSRRPTASRSYIAAYRQEFVELAGQKADGYLARPAESIPSLRGILERLAAAATEAGRDPRAIESAGYLLSLVDETRREALNRAKREPFVIYMMSVLGDVSLRRAGFELELRDRIAAAWRAEDFHERRQAHPRRAARRLHALRHARGRRCRRLAVPRRGRPRSAAAPAGRSRRRRQIDELHRRRAQLYARPARGGALAARRAATTGDPGRAGASAVRRREPRPTTDGLGRRRLGAASGGDSGAAWEILRPFAYTASVIPVARRRRARLRSTAASTWRSSWRALVGGVLLHSGTNIVNEVYDVRQGIDTITSPRASHAIAEGPHQRARRAAPSPASPSLVAVARRA